MVWDTYSGLGTAKQPKLILHKTNFCLGWLIQSLAWVAFKQHTNLSLHDTLLSAKIREQIESPVEGVERVVSRLDQKTKQMARKPQMTTNVALQQAAEWKRITFSIQS